MEEASEAFQVGDLKKWRERAAAEREDSRPKGTYIAVDAACSGPPGPVEYQGVLMPERSVVFKRGPFPDGTNNIGEFLAVVEGMRWVNKNSMTIPIYSDSLCAMSWVKSDGVCKSKMENIGPELVKCIDAAERWMCGQDASRCVKLLRKWDTGEWGEIPADFGRK
jgi:ribonuclease HI